MSKLDSAPVVKSNATNFFSKTTSLIKTLEDNNKVLTSKIMAEKPIKTVKKGRPVSSNQNKKIIKLSISLSQGQKDQLTNALEKYNKSKKDDVFFQPLSMNEFIAALLFTNPQLDKLI